MEERKEAWAGWEALCNMGATETSVNIEKFGKDIESVMAKLLKVDVTAVLENEGGVAAASLSVDEDEITSMLLEIVQVTEDNGLKLPREFGLLVKQSLYFDRYLKILAPGLDVMQDDRVGGLSSSSGEEEMKVLNGDGGPTSGDQVVIDV